MLHTPSLDDMFGHLPKNFSTVEKMAIAFSIYEGMTLENVINLKWTDDLAISWRSEFILARIKLSNNIDYVFWNLIGEIDSQLLLLPKLVNDCFKNNWDDFTSQFKVSIPIEFNRSYW